MGRGSEVSWLKILRRELNIDDKIENEQLRISSEMKGDTAGYPGSNVDMVGSSPFLWLHFPQLSTCGRPKASAKFSGITYHLDDIDLSLSGNNLQIDPYALPPKPIADTLVHAYFATVHPLVPILSKPEFMAIYDQLNNEGIMHISRQWLMVINLVFAVGGRFLETMGRKPEWPHIECFQRARVLGALDGGVLFGIPMLHDVQAMALTGIYLLGSKHTNRFV
jgi:hypothetical protein